MNRACTATACGYGLRPSWGRPIPPEHRTAEAYQAWKEALYADAYGAGARKLNERAKRRQSPWYKEQDDA